MLKLLPFVIGPAIAAAIAYWLTGRNAIAFVAAAVVLGAMLAIGITS
jgi:hypothetical protein